MSLEKRQMIQGEVEEMHGKTGIGIRVLALMGECLPERLF
jgi:hypothetical protein